MAVRTATQVLEAMVAMFDSIEDLFGTHDRAVARIRWRGWRSDGTEIDRETDDIIRVEAGRAIEHWGGALPMTDSKAR